MFTCVYFLHFISVFSLDGFMHFCLSSWRLKACYRGQNASDSVFLPFEIRLGEVEGEIQKGAVEPGKKVVFLHPRIRSGRRNAGGGRKKFHRNRRSDF